ncbi:MAG: ATPase [Lachnospiraceae bacterium]|nr:ATPase [Lachnospiraceae bacterium]
MIVKMKFISITGPIARFDDVIGTYLTKYDIHLENALSELKNVANLRPFSDPNPYKDDLAQCDKLIGSISHEPVAPGHITTREARAVIAELNSELKDQGETVERLGGELAELENTLAQAKPYESLDFSVSEARALENTGVRFGRISLNYYRTFSKFINDNTNIIFEQSLSTRDYVYGVCYIPNTQIEKIDAICSSLHFERFRFPEDLEGTPFEICNTLSERVADCKQRLDEAKRAIAEATGDKYVKLVSAQAHFSHLNKIYDVRKLAACTRNGDQTFFIICGWMSAAQAKLLSEETANITDIFIQFVDPKEAASAPPTLLKNFGPVKPFEMYTKMYGLPSYNEMDPTLFIALTYSFIFGAMFGDVGHGLFLMVFGYLLYALKKMNLAAIIGTAGIFSTFFGFMFGSVFGYEDLIEAVWLKPMNAMTDLPFVGKLNTVFVIAIAFGMALVLVTMVINIINSLKNRDFESGLFSNNGLAGFIFYLTVALCAVLFMTGRALPAGIILGALLGIPVVLMIFKEPLGHILSKNREHAKTSVGMFIAQAFFELFEVMLSYFSNTLSFVRIGAFAVSHAAMMEVVMMLAQTTNGQNMVVVVLGNLFVIGMEGLIVGIQVLRLEYYEFFSRFYHGSGREFKSYRDTI